MYQNGNNDMKTFRATFTNTNDAIRAFEIARDMYPVFNPRIDGCHVTTSSNIHDPDEITIDWDNAGLNDYTWQYL